MLSWKPLQETAGCGAGATGAEAYCLGGNQNSDKDQNWMVQSDNYHLSQEVEKDHLALDIISSAGHGVEEDQS